MVQLINRWMDFLSYMMKATIQWDYWEVNELTWANVAEYM